jgi:hypothetical protein
MSVKAFLKNEQKKRNKDTEVPVVPPADTPAEQAPAAQSLADGADMGEAAKPANDPINGSAEAVDGAPVDNTNGATDIQVWASQ